MLTRFKNAIVLGVLLFSFTAINAQNVGINSAGSAPVASAGLDVDFTDKGVLIPRVALTSTTDVATIASPATSLMIYNTATAGTFPNNVTPGFYFYDGNGWSKINYNSSRRVALAANVPTTSNVLGNVTGLGFSALANKTYKFKFVIYYSASATNVGGRFSLNGPAFTANTLFYTIAANNATSGTWTVTPAIAYGGGVALGSSYTTTLNYCVIEGQVSTTAAGTIIAQFATETVTTTTITVLGTNGLLSYVEYEQLN